MSLVVSFRVVLFCGVSVWKQVCVTIQLDSEMY